MKDEVDRDLGIVDGEETASSSFFAEMGAFAQRFKRRHGDVDCEEVGEEQEGEDNESDDQ